MKGNNQSSEDYLETILLLKRRLGDVRSIDIVNETGYTKPSISVAMKKLRTNGLITVDKNGFINFTEAGEKVAKDTYKKHCCLKSFFMAIGVSEPTAEKDACEIEHEISAETLECIVRSQEKYHLEVDINEVERK